MGYFDDYDSEMGWDYRDESLDDDLSVVMDSDEEDDLGNEFEGEEDEEEELEDGRFEHLPGHRVFERSTFDEDQEEDGDEVESSVTEGESSIAEDERSIAEDESSIAEDEFIHRLASDPFLGNGGSDSAKWSSFLSPPLPAPTIVTTNETTMSVSPPPPPPPPFMTSPLSVPTMINANRTTMSSSPPPSPLMTPTLSMPTMFITNRATMSVSPPPSMTPPSSPLPSSWSPQENEYDFDGVSGIIQRFQSLENQNSGFTRGGSTSIAGHERPSSAMMMISPPASPPPFPYYPPRRPSLVDLSFSKSGQGLSSPPAPLAYLPSPSTSPSPHKLSGRPLPTVPVDLNLKGKFGGGVPRLDRRQIMVEVEERKRNNIDTFDTAGAAGSSSTSASSTSNYSSGGVVDQHQLQWHPSSMVASASNLLRCSRALASQ